MMLHLGSLLFQYAKSYGSTEAGDHPVILGKLEGMI